MSRVGCLHHPGEKHGRFHIISAACERCGRRWELRGCVSIGPARIGDPRRADPYFRYPCQCGTEVAVLVPPFADGVGITVAPAVLPAWSPSDSPRAAARWDLKTRSCDWSGPLRSRVRRTAPWPVTEPNGAGGNPPPVRLAGC
jgi:hypothetical protein